MMVFFSNTSNCLQPEIEKMINKIEINLNAMNIYFLLKI